MPVGEPPVTEVSHERAVGAIGGVVMLATAALVLILGIIFLVDLAWEWVGDDWEEEVFRWDFGLAGIFMLASFGMGIAGAIGAFTLKRFNLALVAAVMLMVSTTGSLVSYEPGFMALYPVLGAIGLACVIMARNGFIDPDAIRFGRAAPDPMDGYGRGGGRP